MPAPSDFALGDFSVDEHRPIKVVVIAFPCRFPQKIPNVQLTVYEKNAGVGGTWYTARYPGIACDSPSHSYQYSFEDKVSIPATLHKPMPNLTLSIP
uniref:FAD-binding monooxygenase BOA2 ) n=1 Tax=Ganoderma boninense TaxID=34458 RepID=A0A5K1K4N6_9APHY|nr:FAD-binding monooxygenase BOA2 (EC (Botcinic acid biosynthesis cluster A protein 2) [Ganoderma boninense]